MERYELELEYDDWVLYRHDDTSPIGYIIRESRDINEIFLAMYRDKISRGKGNSMILHTAPTTSFSDKNVTCVITNVDDPTKI